MQWKGKAYDANNLLALSLVIIIAYNYSLGEMFYCTYLKTTVRDYIILAPSDIW